MIRKLLFGLYFIVFVAAKSIGTSASSSEKSEDRVPPKESLPPCSIVNPANNAFYDLSSLGTPINDKGQTAKAQAWAVRGFDSGYNFTIGVCASPLGPSKAGSSDDVDSSVQNVLHIGGYYTGTDGIKYSIGNFDTTPVFRGKKLVLQYGNGSYCKDPNARPGSKDSYLKDSRGQNLRKSTILSFSCDKEILSKASVLFVGSSRNCDYFFEVRTAHACVTANKADDLAAIWIFFFM